MEVAFSTAISRADRFSLHIGPALPFRIPSPEAMPLARGLGDGASPQNGKMRLSRLGLNRFILFWWFQAATAFCSGGLSLAAAFVS